jgi:LmbE family N-acetylglucosaminyl deacetylase
MSIKHLLPEITASSSVVVFGAHPDDAVRACGGAMLRARAIGARLAVVKATDGAALYGVDGVPDGLKTAAARREEELRGLAVLGVARSSLFLLSFPDGGIEAVRDSYFLPEGKPYYDPWLHADRVEDVLAFRRGVPFFGAMLVELIAELLERYQPTHIFTHQCQDRHPDHRGLTFLVKKAAVDLMLENRLATPAVFEYLTYHTRLKWPANPGPAIDAHKAQELGLPGQVVDFKLYRREETVKNEAQECFVPILGRAYMDPWMRSNEIYWHADSFPGART